jgi:hypothetical protein
MADPIPSAWLPAVRMDRIIAHWTAGAHRASEFDREHYHFLVEANGNIVRGTKSVAANSGKLKSGQYAAHTASCNSYSIGISMCCMAGAIERPFNAGSQPMTAVQWGAMVEAIAQLCKVYGIQVTEKTVLSHAEVEANLGAKQKGKWDFTRLAFDASVIGAAACGAKMRREVLAAMNGVSPGKRPVAPTPIANPLPPPTVPAGGIVDTPMSETAGPEKEGSGGRVGLWLAGLFAVAVTGGAVWWLNPMGWW